MNATTQDQTIYTGHLVILRCWCGLRHGVPEDLRTHQLREHDRGRHFGIYCPLGHEHVPAGKSRLEREQELRQAAEASEQFYRDQAARERRTSAALRGHLTRMKNRIANGVCPVPGCKRSGFSNVMRHIASKHPGWHAEHAHDLDGF
jgi:hypothetical protein